MITEHRLIFNPDSDYDLANFKADASYAIQEASRGLPEDRITSYQLWYDPIAGIVFDPQRGRVEVMRMVTADPNLLKSPIRDRLTAQRIADQETLAFRVFRDAIVIEADKTIALWYSPPLPITHSEPKVTLTEDNNIGYNEGRLTIGQISSGVNDDGCRTMECHCIPITENQTATIIPMINELLTDNELETVIDPEDFRGLTIKIHPGINDICKFLRRYFPFNRIWQRIRDKKPIQRLQQLIENADDLFDQAYQHWVNNSSTQERIAVNQQLIKDAGKLGYNIDIYQLPCAGSVSSSDPLTRYLSNFGKIQDPLKIITTTSAPGSIIYDSGTSTTTNEAKYIEYCGQCGVKLGYHMKKGDCCPNCGGKYQGC